MADSRTLNDRFARPAAPAGKGLAASKDPFAAKTPAPAGDAFAATKPASGEMQDAFAPKSRVRPGYTRKIATAVEVTSADAKPAKIKHAEAKPAPQKAAAFGADYVRPTKTKVTPPAPRRSGMTASIAPPSEKMTRAKSSGLLRPAVASSSRQKSLMVKPTPVTADAPKSPMMMLAGAGLVAPKPQGANGFYNPFASKRPASPPTLQPPAPPARDMFDLDPAFAAEIEADAPPPPAPEILPEVPFEPIAEVTPEPAPAPHPKRALHVVQAAERSVSAIAEAPKPRPAARASSLVLVSGAGAVTATVEAAEAAEAPVAETPPEPEAPTPESPKVETPAASPVAEKPAVPEAAPPPPKADVELGKAFWTGGGGGGGGGSGSGKGPGGGVAAKALARRGFNQDDLFGVVFGIAVLVFLLLWFMRGKGEEASPGDDLIATTQSATTQSAAVLPAPPKADPFGDAPVNLKPSGPIPEAPADVEVAPVAPPAATPAPAPVAPAAVAPPQVAANPEAALPIAQRKMHAWFCTASSRLTKPSRTELTGEMAKFEDVFKGKELVVRGYADTRGSTELNVDLGARRAQTVADYLTARGLSVVDVQGVGELEGLDDNQNCPNQRRVDVWVKGGPAETPSRACAPEPEVESLMCG